MHELTTTSNKRAIAKKGLRSRSGYKPKYTIPELLLAIKLNGSINKAAKALGMSFSGVQGRIAPLYGTPELAKLNSELTGALTFASTDFLMEAHPTLRKMMKRLERRPDKWMISWGIVSTNRSRMDNKEPGDRRWDINHKITIEDKRGRFLRIDELTPVNNDNGN